MGLLAATLFYSTSFLTLCTVAFSLWSAICLLKNYLIARRIGVPIKVIPIDHVNPLWVMLGKHVIPYVRKLPIIGGENSFTRYNYRGWEWHDRYRTHHEVGEVFLIVSPGRIWLHLAHPEALVDFFRRRNDFPRCLEMTERLLDVFGQNISTVEGPAWKTQRKLFSSCLNEQTNAVVWSESISLASQILSYWAALPSVSSTADDVRTLSLGVLSKAVFGRSYPFEGGHPSQREQSPPSLTYKAALQTILENCVLIMALTPRFFTHNRFLPRIGYLQRIKRACLTFERYITATYEEAKEKLSQDPEINKTRARTFMTAMVQASLYESGGGMTEEQIRGNIFVLNFAGHDTTAHTINFAVYLLAAHPKTQAWLSQEINAVLGASTTLNYARDYPRLKRCLAVLYETIRLFTPVPVSKWTGSHPPGIRTLKVGDKLLEIPNEVMMIPSYASVQTDPRYWGDDPLTWNPERWILPGGTPGTEEMLTPRKGTYMGWSEGARDCPGRKFSEVEVVAALATLFREWRVEPLRLGPEESREEAQRRVLELVEKDSGPVLLLQMLHPERAPLTWRKGWARGDLD